jgi:hypothetical protein
MLTEAVKVPLGARVKISLSSDKNYMACTAELNSCQFKLRVLYNPSLTFSLIT